MFKQLPFYILLFIFIPFQMSHLYCENFNYWQNLNKIKDKKITDIDIQISNKNLVKNIKHFFPKTNTLVDLYKINRSIELLYLTGQFSDIHVKYSLYNEKNVKLIFQLTPIKRAHKIIFTGNTKISDSELSKLSILKQGSPLSKIALKEISQKIINSYKSIGFNNCQVKYNLSNFKNNRYFVQFSIMEGSPLKVKEVFFIGANGLENKLKKTVNLKKNSVLNLKLLETDKEKIINYLSENNYPFSKVNDPQLHDEKNNPDGVNIHWTIELGERNLLVFRPKNPFKIDLFTNVSYDKNDFLEFLNLKQYSAASKDTIENITSSIRKFYEIRGYVDIHVYPKQKYDNTSKLTKNIFYIDYGNLYKFDINLLGVKKLSIEEVLKQIYSSSTMLLNKIFNKNHFDISLEQIITLYRSRGFLDAEIDGAPTYAFNKNKSMVLVTIKIIENKQTLLRSTDFTGISDSDKLLLLKKIQLKTGQGFAPFAIDAPITIIENFFKNRGYFNVKVSTKDIVSYTEDNLFADLNFSINLGPKVRIGSIIHQGNYITRSRIISREINTHYLTLKSGSIYSPKLIDAARAKIASTGVFQSVSIIPKTRDDTPSKIDLIIKTVEKDPGLLKVLIGYKNERGLRLGGSISNNNLFGMNRTVYFNTDLYQKISQEENPTTLKLEDIPTYEYIFQLGFIEPWLFNSRHILLENLKFSNTFLWEKRETNAAKIDLHQNLSTSLEKQLSRYGNLKLNYQYEKYRAYHKGEETKLSANISKIIPILELDHRDNAFKPTSGTYNTISMEYASPMFLAKYHYLKLELTSNYYFPIISSLVLATSLRGGTSKVFTKDELGEKNLPLLMRYYLGGRSSVRGFPQDSLGPMKDDIPLGGNHYINYKIELRKKVTDLFGVVLFGDGGNVYLKGHPYEMRHSWGMGLRYLTPIGPISFEYGLKLAPQKHETRSAIHVSIGTF